MKKESVKDSYELASKLSQIFGKRMMIETISSYNVEGIIDERRFSINYFKDENLMLSIDCNSKDTFADLFWVIKELTGLRTPTCSYNIDVLDDQYTTSLTNVEWISKNVDERLYRIINGKAFSSHNTVTDIRLYNGKKINDYVDSNSKIYGLYPGSIEDTSKIDNLSEVELYFAIDKLGGHIYRCNDAMRHRENFFIDLTEEQYALEYLVYKTKKFGVKLPEPEIGKHIIPSDSYWSWIRFYDKHFKHTLTDEEWLNLQLCRRYGASIQEFLPKKTWSESIKSNVK